MLRNVKRLASRIVFAVLSLFVLSAVVLTPLVMGASVRGVAGDTWADIVLGQPDFEDTATFSTVANRLLLPHGVFIDTTNPADQKMYVYDAGNNRILGFDVEDCRTTGTDPYNCNADLVIGQSDFTSSPCNGDSGFQNYPTRAAASASTLCGSIESQLSLSEGGSGSSMDVDADGNLYTVDFENHRVLKYIDPYATDTVADEVWGQADFTGNLCNRGGSTASNSLCFSWGDSNNWTAGVDIDSHGNLWVVDSGNNRILRFPNSGGTISKTANLVLGQANFTSSGTGTGLNQLHDPAAVRVTDNDEVIVAESYNSRILMYTTLTNGASATEFGSGFLNPSGVDFDPTEPGRVWLVNRGHSLIELWDIAGETQVRTLGLVDNGNVVGDGSGSVGFDKDGNAYIATGLGDYNNSVIIFDKGDAGVMPSSVLLTPSGHGNYVDQYGIGSGRGVAVTDDQVIVADAGRILFWNTPNGLSDLTSGKPADGYAYTTNFTTQNNRCCMNLRTDDAGHLYASLDLFGSDPSGIAIFNLPLTNGENPASIITYPINLLGGGQITDGGDPSQIFSGLEPAADGSFIWASDRNRNRVFRIRNPLTSPVIDVVLGQANAAGTSCNRGGSEAANTLCNPGELSFDNDGNLYVSDAWLEAEGNMRLLKFNAATIPVGNVSVLYGPNADLVIDDIGTWQPTFNFANRFVTGFNPYWTGVPFPVEDRWFPGIYEDIDGSGGVPDDHLSDYYSMGYASTFDPYGNLYMTDLNRARLLIYETPMGNAAPVVSTVTAVPGQSTDTTPNYTFTTSQAGTIAYGGSCTSASSFATLGLNTITFNPLSPGTYSNCTITVTNSDSLISNVLNVGTFTIQSQATSTSSSTPAPADPSICQANVPVGVADLFQINRSGKDARLYFTPVKDNTANYHVIFGHKNGQELYGALSEPVSPDAQTGVQYLDIHQLDPSAEYWFKVAPVNGCAVGEWSNWMQTKRVSGRQSIFYKYVQQVKNLVR